MDEYFRLIEEQIRQAGCPLPIRGEDIYNDICDQMEDKEPGDYLLLSKGENDTVFQYQITILEDQFNLSSIRITTDSQTYVIVFD